MIPYPSSEIARFGPPVSLELSTRVLELNNLKFFEINPLLDPPSHVTLYTTIVVHQEVSKVKTLFFPYVWLPKGPPHYMKDSDYDNVIFPEFVGSMIQAFETLRWNYSGTVALTAGHQKVLFFPHRNLKDVLCSLAKKFGPGFLESVGWRWIPSDVPHPQNTHPTHEPDPQWNEFDAGVLFREGLNEFEYSQLISSYT
ncbi:hypothetical protein BYT27DRAFT_6703368 [Phlegmacium glaucopus]|nr:hypothetical protein BYT27DRAFT_6703368 [Phlegmacium glaucopus]